VAEVGPCDQRFDALVHIAQALLQTDHSLAAGGEAEVAGLDDAGVHRSNWDLVQALALCRQEVVAAFPVGLTRKMSERAAHAPDAVVEPRPLVQSAQGMQTEQIMDGALETDRRWMMPPDRGEAPCAGQAEHADRAGLVEQRHVRHVRLAEQAEQGRAAHGEVLDRGAPAVF
jgi:hypothetical protein